MRIDRAGQAGAAGARRARRTAGLFSPPEEAPGGPAAPDPGLAASAVLPLCLLARDQPDAAPATPDAAGTSHGRAVLGALAGLQLATLGGGGGHARQTLADLARTLPRAADPGLDELLQAIAQRAAIELARAG